MNAKQAKRVVGVLAGVLLVAANSQAALVCSGWTANTAMTTLDMTFGSPAEAATAANACAWSTVPKAHKVGNINTLWQHWDLPPGNTTGVAFVQLAKWDMTGGLTSSEWLGYRWVLDRIVRPENMNPHSTGQYRLTATALSAAPAIPLPHIFDFVGVLKGGSGAGSWFFNDRLLDRTETITEDETVTVTGMGGGIWTINFQNNGNNIPDLSHLSIFARPVGPPNGVPTPGTLPLVGLALLAGWVAARRRSEAA